MSALFGHTKGAFTGAAISGRPGLLLLLADGGVLTLLDEIGELRLDEQAMLLRSLEEKRFLPVGSDTEVKSDFQLIAGTNRDLAQAVDAREFRDDLLARINLWTFRLPALKDRPEDIEPNIAFELEQFARTHGSNVTFNKEARDRFVSFSTSSCGHLAAQFPRPQRQHQPHGDDVRRRASALHISIEVVEEENPQPSGQLASPPPACSVNAGADLLLSRLLTTRQLDEIDPFDRVQL